MLTIDSECDLKMMVSLLETLQLRSKEIISAKAAEITYAKRFNK
jgi:hypothetical protein